MTSLKIRLLTLVLYITVVEWHVKSRRFSARLIRPFIRYSGRRPSYIILSSPYTCAQLRIVLVHFFVASNVARYSAFNRAVSLGNTLLWRFSFRYAVYGIQRSPFCFRTAIFRNQRPPIF